MSNSSTSPNRDCSTPGSDHDGQLALPKADAGTIQRLIAAGSQVIHGENLDLLRAIPSESIPLIYIDPPFNTGKSRKHTQLRTERDESGDRVGFQGRTYRTTRGSTQHYADAFDDYLAFLEPRLEEAYRVLSSQGTLYVHLDYREVHYVKVLLDTIFGRACFLNEIIWAYDFGGRSNRRWPAKHDNILVYVKSPDEYVFNTEEVDRIPYLAPGLVGPEKAARGKLPTDTWWHTIVPTAGREKTGYPTQKPLGILRRIVAASSIPGDLVLDFFAGSGTTGMAALEIGRRCLLVDESPQAIEVMRRRFSDKAAVSFASYEMETSKTSSTGDGDVGRSDDLMGNDE